MFGFLNIKKPKGITSFDVISKLRKILGIKKIGHTGTLDPLAEGVLPVAIGDCTKLIQYLNGDKKYIAKIKFGENSTTYDEEGEKTPVEEPDFSKEEFLQAFEDFKGEIEQVPPQYSAIKINGQKLYNLARKGIETQIPSRRVTVYDIKLLDFELPYVEIEVSCSCGTYIRSIAYDLGKKLGCGAYLSALKRTSACGFDIKNSQKIEDNLKIINPLDILNFKIYELNDSEFSRIKNGNSIVARNLSKNEKLALTYQKKLVSIASIFDKIIKVEKVFAQNLEGGLWKFL